jgi:Tfp pilus assembly protein PilZ
LGRVLIYSTAGNESELIKQRIDNDVEDVIVDIVSSETDMMKFLILNTVNVIVLNFDSLSAKKVQLTRDLRALGNTSALVILSPQVDHPTLKKMEKIYKSVIVQKPVRKNDLLGVIKKFMGDQIVPQRLAERFYTDHPSQIESFGTAAKTNSRMLNVSKTGAYLETNESPKFAVGDLIRLDVELNQLRKTRSVHAKVVWVSPLHSSAGGFGTGIHFIPDNQVYRHMLNMV